MNLADTPHPLQTVLDVEQAQRDVAQARLQQAESQLADARAKAAHLGQHRIDTVARWQHQAKAQAGAEMLLTYRNFMQRLDQALAQQELQLERCVRQVDRAREALIAAEVKVAAVQKLLDRRARERADGERRRDQKAADEQAQCSRFSPSRMSEFTSMV
jgi:flagellar FliJ protein